MARWGSTISAIAGAALLSACGYTISVTPNGEVTATQTEVVTETATPPTSPTPLQPTAEPSGTVQEPELDQLTIDVCSPNVEQLPDLVDYSDNGYYVLVIQQVAESFGLDPGPLDGEYGPRTIAAVKELQAIVGADVDGQVGPQTWGAIRSVLCPPMSNGAGAAVANLLTEDDAISLLRSAFPGWALEEVPASTMSNATSSWYASSAEMVLETSGAVAFAFLYPDSSSINESEVVYLDTTMRNINQTFPLVQFDRIQCGNAVFVTRVEARAQFEDALPAGITCSAI